MPKTATRSNGHFIGRLARILVERFPVNDRESPPEPPPHLRRDVGLMPDDPPGRWPEYR